MPLNIKLISPKMSLRPMDSEFKRRMSAPLSLLVLAALTDEKHTVIIEDENIRKLNLNDSPDLVGITVNVDTIYRAIELSEHYRNKGSKVVMGGILPSADPERLKQHADAVCIGEAENLWGRIIRDVENASLQKVYQSPLPTQMKDYPLPRWSVLKSPEKYLYNNVMVASRGCPHTCDFCYNSCEYVHHKYRNRPVEAVLKDIDALKTSQVMFIDDNFAGNISWLREFLDAIEGRNLLWHCAVSTRIYQHPDIIERMAGVGCRSLFIGFESVHPESLKAVGKSQNHISEYDDLVKIIHDSGMMVNASFAFGFDHDTQDIFPMTLDWLIRNKIETMTGHILTPYPGTRLYYRLKAEGRIIDEDLRHYNTSHVVFQPKHMSPHTLREEYLNMYKQFYSFKNIRKRRPDNLSLRAPYYMFNYGYRKFGRLTSVLGKAGMMSTIGKLGRKLSYGI